MWDEIKHPTLYTFRIYLGFFRKYLKENIKLYCLLLAQNSVIIEICYKGNHFLCLMWEKILNSKYFSRRMGFRLIGQSYTRIPSAHKTQADFRAHFGVKKVHLMRQEICYYYYFFSSNSHHWMAILYLTDLCQVR